MQDGGMREEWSAKAENAPPHTLYGSRTDDEKKKEGDPNSCCSRWSSTRPFSQQAFHKRSQEKLVETGVRAIALPALTARYSHSG